jgi:zinc protease
MAAYIINHILGGGSFSSRLYREVREKRGLAYGVSDSLIWLNHASLLLGSTATRADATGQTIDIIEQEIRKLAEEGPTEEEFVKAKTYLKGSFALGLDTSNRIASQLVQMQLDNLGIDYIERRPALIDAVTLDDAKRVAKRLLDPGLLVTVVGRPRASARPRAASRIAQPCRQAGTSAREPGIGRNGAGAFARIRSGAPCPDIVADSLTPPPGFMRALERAESAVEPACATTTADDAMLVR